MRIRMAIVFAGLSARFSLLSLVTVLLITVLAAGQAAAQVRPAVHAPTLHLQDGQEHWQFDVYLDGRAIGSHSFRIEHLGREQRVESRASYAVRVLLVPAFRYEHVAREIWRDGCLTQLQADTSINGRRTAVRAEALAQGLQITRQEANQQQGFLAPGCAASFAYWDARLLQRSELINAQTGEPRPVVIEALGEETIAVADLAVAARRYRILESGLAIDLWYAQETGRWLALAGELEDGRQLSYRLRSYEQLPPRISTRI